MMRRRQFIEGLGSAAVWPLVAQAQQQAQHIPRIVMLNGFAESDPTARSFAMETFQALLQLGWEGGRNIEIVQRWAAGDIGRIGMLAKELVALQPDVIIAVGTPATDADIEQAITLLGRNPTPTGARHNCSSNTATPSRAPRAALRLRQRLGIPEVLRRPGRWTVARSEIE
jgi:hypothetical protein